MDILTIGEVLIDLTQTGKDARGIPQFAANPGGAPANLAVGRLARLGAQTAFIGKVGADAFGRYLKEVLAVRHLMSMNFSAPRSAAKPASVTA